MASILQNNQTAFRACILYEVKLGRSIKEAYENMCTATENDKIDYVDFEYWFYRFYHGNFDLDYDRSLDPEPLSFSDLPIEMLGEIASKLDLVSRFRTRKVSQVLRSVVDAQKIHYETIGFCAYPNYIEIYFDGNTIHYKKNDGVFTLRNAKHKIIDDDFVRIAVNDFAIVIKNPKLQLREFLVLLNENANTANEMVLKVFETLKSPMHVNFMEIDHAGDKEILSILSSLKPGSLESIKLDSMNKNTKVSQTVKTEQWKQAKKSFVYGPQVNITDFLHFEDFEIKVESISTQDVILLRDALSRSKNFTFCRFYIRHHELNMDEIKRVLGAAVNQDENIGIINHRYKTPESNNFLDFDFEIKYRQLIIRKTR